LRKAYEDRDLTAITDLFNSEDIKDVGGYESFLEFLDLGGSAARRTTSSFAVPQSLEFQKKKWFGVVPFNMVTLLPKGERRTETCLIGISDDDGRTWKFKTGESFFKDYPEMVGLIEIVERKEILKGAEQ
jgi:hypothetical protein